MPKVDIANAQTVHGTAYPEEFAAPCLARRRWRLGDGAGLTQFGVNLLRLPAGAWSSQRHWHSAEDEFAYVLEGEVVLIDDHGETLLKAGDCAGFRAGDPNGHHLVNRSAREAVVLEVGSRRPEDRCDYPDIDMIYLSEGDRTLHRDGRPYAPSKRRSA
jgi:uncharacterized cupin superfamily protein